MILGVISALFFNQPANTPSGLLSNIIAILLLMTANFLDSADGQLARMTNQKTQLGRILDGSAGDIWFIAIYISLSLRLLHQPIPLIGIEWGAWAFILAAISGLLCHARQCALADYYRTIHLFFLSGKPYTQFDTYAQQKAIFQATKWKDQPVWKFFLMFYVNYTKGQESQTPHFQHLFHLLSQNPQHPGPEHVEGQNPQNPAIQKFLQGSRPLMKWTNILTFNTRAIVLYISCLIDRPWIYWIFEITIMTIIFLHMRHRHEKLCKTITSNL